MTEKKLKIVNKLGLHARPASLLVQTAMKFSSNISIIKDESTIDGKSIMGLMMLAAGCGSELTVRIDGCDEKNAMEKIEELFMSGFGEEI
ncbi:MAG: HPr family phosphocarrier protein [Endomicrobiaceae bacterium]|jgi:phosphocarrier protein|nr:HPr family phosphocarrier protein [Endomicrobiaceae bacterium]